MIRLLPLVPLTEFVKKNTFEGLLIETAKCKSLGE